MPTRLATIAAIGALAAGLSACAPDDHQLGTGPSATAPGTFGPTDDPVNDSIGVNCQTLVSNEVMYEWGSGNFAIDVDYEPAAASAAAEVADSGGLACSWINLSSGETLDVAVASLSDDELAAARDSLASGSESVSVFDAEGWFAFDGTAGHADAFRGRYWLNADSTWFFEAADAAPIVNAALTALG